MSMIIRRNLCIAGFGLCCILTIYAPYELNFSLRRKRNSLRVGSNSTSPPAGNDIYNSYNNDISLPYLPLYVGSGQGTTGTRSMHRAMCKLGIPSVHYSMTCFQHNGTIIPEAKEGAVSHYHVMMNYKTYIKCFGVQNCTFERGVDILKKIKHHVEKVVTSGIMAVHDSPYPYMMPYILDLLEKERGGRPIILFTDRDLDSWVESRTNGSSVQTLLRNDAQHALDYDYWLERLQQGATDEQCSNIFTSYSRQTSLQEQEEFKAYLKRAAMYHRERMLSLKPEYQINLFTTPTRMNVTELAQHVWDATKLLFPKDAVKDIGVPLETSHVNHVVNTTTSRNFDRGN